MYHDSELQSQEEAWCMHDKGVCYLHVAQLKNLQTL